MNITPIIIINWNGIQDTHECIDSVLSLQNVNYHIHLIDNNSDNNEGEQLNNYYKSNERLTCHLYNKNYGFTKAHIKIWKEIIIHQPCEYIALLNNDTIVHEDWLFELIQAAKANKAEVVSSKMINYYDRAIMDNAGHFMINTGEIMPIGHGEPIGNYTNCFDNIGACAGACIYKKSMIETIDFFDPYFSTGYEDAEYGLRATISQYRCIFAPKAIVFHKMGQSIKKVFDQSYSIMIQTSILYSYFKLMPLSKILFDIPSFIIKFVSMVIIDILFLRFGYLKLLLISWFNIIKQSKLVINKRKLFYERIDDFIAFSKLNNKINWFLPYDVERFWNIFVNNKKSSIDSYGAKNQKP